MIVNSFKKRASSFLPQIEKEWNLAEHNFIKREPSASSQLPITLASLQDAPKCTVDMLRNLFALASNAITFKQEEILWSIRLLLTYFSQKYDDGFFCRFIHSVPWK